MEVYLRVGWVDHGPWVKLTPRNAKLLVVMLPKHSWLLVSDSQLKSCLTWGINLKVNSSRRSRWISMGWSSSWVNPH